jgi:RND family efflux transporter MFP subunit
VVAADPVREQVVSSRIGGRLERLLVTVGSRVEAGAPIAELFSAEFVAAQEELILAAARARTLGRSGDSTLVRALAAAARRRLLQAGADEALIARLQEGGGGAEPRLTIRAPIGGSLVEQGTVVGSAVEAGEMLFRLVDLREVDVVAAVPERAIASLRIGMAATVTVPALGRPSYQGRLERIRDLLDTETRTIDAVLHVPNASGLLRPGMFANVTLTVPGDPSISGVRIPEAAVLVDGTDRIVFVRLGPARYARRAVLLADEPTGAGGFVIVTAGLAASDSVVVRGAFTLKSELAKAALAEDDH